MKNDNLTKGKKRDAKAKQKAHELLKDVDLKPEINEKVFEIKQEKNEKLNEKDMKLLREQVSLLSEKCKTLEAELAATQRDYAKILTENLNFKNSLKTIDSDIKANVIKIFNELQTNHLNMGNNFIIYPVAFMNRLILFFPFLAEHKRF